MDSEDSPSATPPPMSKILTASSSSSGDSESTTWDCPSCTFSNNSLLFRCEMCNTERPKGTSDEDTGIAALLIEAVQSNNHDSARSCLESNIDVNSEIGKTTPLLYAIMGNQPSMVKLLLEYKARQTWNLNPEEGELTALHLVGRFGREEVAITEILIEAKGDPNAISSVKGHTPLMWAAMNDSKGPAYALLTKGADPTLLCGRGWTAAEWAEKAGNPQLVALIQSRGKSYIPPVARRYEEHPHDTIYVKSAYSATNGFICDACRKNVPKDYKSWNCTDCRFDLCDSCAAILPHKQSGSTKEPETAPIVSSSLSDSQSKILASLGIEDPAETTSTASSPSKAFSSAPPSSFEPSSTSSPSPSPSPSSPTSSHSSPSSPSSSPSSPSPSVASGTSSVRTITCHACAQSNTISVTLIKRYSGITTEEFSPEYCESCFTPFRSPEVD